MVPAISKSPIPNCPPTLLAGTAPCIYIDDQILGETALAFIFKSDEQCNQVASYLEAHDFHYYEEISAGCEHDFRALFIDAGVIDIPLSFDPGTEIITAIVDKRFDDCMHTLLKFERSYLVPALIGDVSPEEMEEEK